MLLTTAAIWGFAFVAQVLGSDHVGAFTFNGLRFVVGGVTLIPVYLLFERDRDARPTMEKRAATRRTVLGALAAGGILFIASALQQYGIQLTRNPGKAGFMTGLYIVITPICYFLFFRKKSSWNTWAGAIAAVAGLYLLCLREGEGFLFGMGEALLLAGALFWTAHMLVVDHFIADISPLRFSSWQFIFCGLLSLLLALPTETITLTGIWNAKWALLFCSFLSVGVGYTFQMIGQKHCPPTNAAIIFSMESVFAAIGGILWNLMASPSWRVDQEILPVGYVGCAAILLGIILSQIPIHKRKKAP